MLRRLLVEESGGGLEELIFSLGSSLGHSLAPV
jgi:hypothetical protein